jgi:hypothetical protein
LASGTKKGFTPFLFCHLGIKWLRPLPVFSLHPFVIVVRQAVTSNEKGQ